jgi:hypothetical protein
MHYWEASYLFRNKQRKLRLPDDSLTIEKATKLFKAIGKERRWKLLKVERRRL